MRTITLLLSLLPFSAQAVSLDVGGFLFEVDESMQVRFGASQTFEPVDSLIFEKNGTPVTLKLLDGPAKAKKSTKRELLLAGSTSGWKKVFHAWVDPKFPGAVILQSSYTNVGKVPLKVLGWTSAQFRLPQEKAGTPWALLPTSTSDRLNWLQPLPEGTVKENFLGMTSTDYGGGTPMAAIWGQRQGFAVGILEKEPKQVTLVTGNVKDQGPHLSVALKQEKTVKPGGSITTYRSFLLPFQGDPFSALEKFSHYLRPEMHARVAPKAALGPIWCAWGYGRPFTPAQVLATLPKVKELGFEWVGIDDGWQETIGDWTPNKAKFPGGEKDFKKFIDEIHRQGFKVQLWWAPLAAHKDSAYVKKFPERLLRNQDGTPRDITWWDAWYLCPANPAVERDMAQLTRKFIGEWGIDGLKLDGQHLNSSAPCFEKKHRHPYSEFSAEQHSRVQKAIYEAALAAKKNALVEACPCGTSFSVYNLPWQNMTVASDPLDSIQVRQKGKVLRALSGDSSVYFGDHVELTRGDGDFASTVGTGGLVGSNFSLASQNPPEPPPGDPTTVLTPEREAHWKKWLRIARQYPLWKGKYRGELYDIAFSVPETHAVEYLGSMHYAFYAPSFSGELEFKGLNPNQDYEIEDYVNGKVLGAISGSKARLKSNFSQYLLVVARPKTATSRGSR